MGLSEGWCAIAGGDESEPGIFAAPCDPQPDEAIRINSLGVLTE